MAPCAYQISQYQFAHPAGVSHGGGVRLLPAQVHRAPARRAVPSFSARSKFLRLEQFASSCYAAILIL